MLYAKKIVSDWAFSYENKNALYCIYAIIKIENTEKWAKA